MSPKTTQFEKLLEAVPDALVGVDQKGVIRFVNRQSELLFGYDREQLIGEHIDMLAPEPLWQVYVDHREDYFADPDNRSLGLDLELIGRHQNGSEFPINVTMSLIDTGDVLLAITGVGDVTRRQQAVAKAELLDAIVEYSDDAIIGLTLDGIITSWNPAAERMYGYSSTEVIGRSGSLLTPEERAGELDAILARIKDGQYVEHLETFNVRKDGTVFPTLLTVSPIRDPDGAVVGASVICRDTTERVHAAKVLATTSWQYRLLAENASDLVVLASPDGVITWVSPSVTRTLGWAAVDLLGTRLVDLIDPDDVAAKAAAREVLYSGHKPATPPGGLLMRIRTKSGQYRWMSGDATRVTDESGVYVGVVSGLRDVEDLVQAQEAAKAGEAALRATLDSLMDPHVRLEAVRDESGHITDFVYVDANPAACAYNRIDYQNLIGARLLDLQPGSVDAGILDQYRQVVETGEPLALDDSAYAQELLSGRERRYDVRATRVGDGLSYTWRDVTDRYDAAKWLAGSEEHYRLLAENASDVVMRLSPDRRFEWVSGSIGDVLGWAATDLLGHVIDEFIHPEELAVFVEAVIETGPKSAASTEFRFRRSDGRYRWVACHTRLKLDEDGTAVAVVGGMVDIETRKQVEAQELDRLETLERFQRLTIGRELKMIELKNEIETLRRLVHREGDEYGDSTNT